MAADFFQTLEANCIGYFKIFQALEAIALRLVNFFQTLEKMGEKVPRVGN